jgi:hypothetical protein
MNWIFDPRSLPARMILSTIFVVVITALTVGLPAIWVIRGQLVLQAWEQLEHGQSTVKALYTARQVELSNLATLVAQRPTVQDLLVQENPAALQEYLSTLRLGAAVDHILICGRDRQLIGHSGSAVPANICQANPLPEFYRVPGDDHPRVMLTATHPLSLDGSRLGQVMVTRDLDQEFIDKLQLETGMDQTLLVEVRQLLPVWKPKLGSWLT